MNGSIAAGSTTTDQIGSLMRAGWEAELATEWASGWALEQAAEQTAHISTWMSDLTCGWIGDQVSGWTSDWWGSTTTSRIMCGEHDGKVGSAANNNLTALYTIVSRHLLSSAPVWNWKTKNLGQDRVLKKWLTLSFHSFRKRIRNVFS